MKIIISLFVIDRVNSVYTEILTDSGAELSVIGHKFISKYKQQFEQSTIGLINKTQSATAVYTKENVNKQIYVNINKDDWCWEIPFVVVDNLIYDVIIGIGQVHGVQVKINLFKQIMECNLENKAYKF